MIQFSILSGPCSGQTIAPVRYPFQIGRDDGADLQLNQPGVWPRHASFDVRWLDGVWLQSEPNAMTTVNGHRVDQVRLRNGDLIEVGSVRMVFSLQPARQRGLGWRETLFWSGMALLWVGQGYLIWRVLP
jgi:pSer/pThr/pTyr-binding forkhead associated (FHA) protein